MSSSKSSGGIKVLNNNKNTSSDVEEKPKLRNMKKCRKCKEIGHVEKHCMTTEGGCLFIRDLPPSYTEAEVRLLVEQHGGKPVNLKVGVDRFGSGWALVNMETKEGGEEVIRSLDEVEVKGREVFVKWRDDGMWACPDPSCGARNFDTAEACFRCRFPASKLKLFS